MSNAKKIILISLILFSNVLFAVNEKFYLNGANTSDEQNNIITSGLALVKQNVKKSDTIKFNLLYVTPQGKTYAICGSFQTIDDNSPKRFIISKNNLMIENKDAEDDTEKKAAKEEDKKFNDVWANFCE
ncbi:hypothetical protein OAO18_00385 [Francisellaceae bacterium]|nr:hypothetical protein [Francisellaceae bacterium]